MIAYAFLNIFFSGVLCVLNNNVKKYVNLGVENCIILLFPQFSDFE